MKMAGTLALVVAAAMVLRSTALTALAARGIVLDVLSVVTVVWALRQGETWGATLGFALGLAADLDAGRWLGRHAMVLARLGYVTGRGGHSLVRESPRTQLVLFFLTTLVHEAWVAAFDFGGLAAWMPLARRALLSAATTAPAVTLLLFVLRQASGRPVFGHDLVHPGPPA